MQLHKLKVHASEVIRMIPDAELAKLAKDTKVDYCAKVLTGERMFYLLLYAFLMADRQSQRKLESVFAQPSLQCALQLLGGYEGHPQLHLHPSVHNQP